MDQCKYVHYEIDYPESAQKPTKPSMDMIPMKSKPSGEEETRLIPPQVNTKSLDDRCIGRNH